MNTEEIEKQRQLRVVKSNDLIRKGRFNLSLVEQRIVLYMITKIKPTDTAIESITFDIKEFCEVCGIKYQQNMSQLKDVIKVLADKSMWINLPNGKQTLIRWIEKPYLDSAEGSGIIEMRLDRDLTPYLVNLKQNFTEYQLISILALKSKYSVKLYELLKSYSFMGSLTMSLDDLREYLQLEDKYKEIKYFNKCVIEKAISEINEFTDIEVEYSTIKRGRSITGYSFQISESDTADFVVARAYLEKQIPSRHQRDKHFKEFLQSNAGILEEAGNDQLSLFNQEV